MVNFRENGDGADLLTVTADIGKIHVLSDEAKVQLNVMVY